jgi:heavy metal sensor kinase
VRWLLAAVLALYVGAAGAGGWALVAAALRPIDRVAAAASRISEQSLSERLPVAASARELHTLVEVLNGMIERLAAAVETQKRFTADASHELRTPVTVVQNEVEVALVKPRSPREYQAVLRSVLEECQRMSRLVGDLLVLARADSSPRPLRPVEVPLDDLCRLVVEEFQPRAQARGIELAATTPASGPAVLGDPDSLRRLLENLVENAVNHTPTGGRAGVRLTEHDGQAVLSVWDTGPGIPPEHLPHLFERFYRVEPGRGAGGTGLGLAICDQIARQHGGSLRVESRDRQGTELIASLPYLSASHGDPP